MLGDAAAVPILVPRWRERGQPAVLLLEERELDEELDVEDGAVLVDEVVLVPRPGVDLDAAAEDAADGCPPAAAGQGRGRGGLVVACVVHGCRRRRRG